MPHRFFALSDLGNRIVSANAGHMQECMASPEKPGTCGVCT